MNLAWFGVLYEQTRKYLIVALAAALLVVVGLRGFAAATEPEPTPVPVTGAVAISALRDAEATPEPMETASADAEAEALARVLYGLARFHGEEAQEAVCWCVINRVESAAYPNSVEEVCAQPAQWMGYAEGNPVMEDLYGVALGVLEVWRTGGHRLIAPDYLYLSWSADSITLRTSYIEGRGTHYWEAE